VVWFVLGSEIVLGGGGFSSEDSTTVLVRLLYAASERSLGAQRLPIDVIKMDVGY